MLENKQGETILICCNAYPPNFIGGAELIAHYQAKELQNKGYKVIVFAGETQSISKRHEVKKDTFEGLDVYRIGLNHEDFEYNYVNFKNIASEKVFIEIIKQHQPKVVHFHNMIGLSINLPKIAKEQGVKTVLTVHDHWGYCYKNTTLKDSDTLCSNHTECVECMTHINNYNQNIPMVVRKDYFKSSLDYIDAFISPSQYLADAYVKVGTPKQKMNVIWNGINVERFSKVTKKADKNGKIRFTFVGYFGQHKGVMVLLNALNQLPNKQNILINLVGDGDQKPIYQNFIKQHRLEEQVKFWGKVPNSKIEEVYSSTDIYILPSIWPENQPVSITEAMAAGIPVITTNMGGSIELVDDQINGYLFNVKDAEQLAKKMNHFIESKDKIEIFGQRAKHKMSQFSFSHQVDKIIKLYESIEIKQKPNNNIYIALAGKQINPIWVQAINSYKDKLFRETELIMLEWVDQSRIGAVDMIIVLDDMTNLDDIIEGIINKIPLLVPETNSELTRLVIKANNGLYYQNEKDFEGCISYLLNNHKISREIGNNGYRYIQSIKSN